MGNWNLVYYSTLSGREPVQEFIDKLQEKTKAKVYNTFELLSEFGNLLGMPHAKKVIGTPLWELRILGESSTRFFYIAKTGQTFIILHGFSKKTQKIPQKEIKTALERLKESQNKH